MTTPTEQPTGTSPALAVLKATIREIKSSYVQVFCRECKWLGSSHNLTDSLVTARNHAKRTKHKTTVRMIDAIMFIPESELTP